MASPEAPQLTFSLLRALEGDGERTPRWQDQFTHQRDLSVQLVISVALGLSAFIAFCILRPKWSQLYSARKKQATAASRLPDLPKTMFGWIPVLYRISEEEVLASAGLDAFVVCLRGTTRHGIGTKIL